MEKWRKADFFHVRLKSLHVVMSSISALCVSPKSGHKRDVKCKGGPYVVHDGDKASMELSNRLKLHRGQKKQAQGEKKKCHHQQLPALA